MKERRIFFFVLFYYIIVNIDVLLLTMNPDEDGPRKSYKYLWSGVDEFHLLFKSFFIEDRATLALGCFIVFALSIISELAAEWLHKNQNDFVASYAHGRRSSSRSQTELKRIRQFSFISSNRRYLWLACANALSFLLSQLSMLVLMTFNINLIASNIAGAAALKIFHPPYIYYFHPDAKERKLHQYEYSPL
ncbi:Oidioi.mRNA.OKI2018_I69.XSR.g16531.t1.cds [Oikopleura dioica]|uniref:Copper transport protein n=1 Tax=Oikopleura dioica TaxID=34765 RepID=A0ABN7SLI1_OIKDI|nr:Oidioi.mRNA.OKI2018_I69.XSR.g16531.t1.cds [Oikopleura dioica]